MNFYKKLILFSPVIAIFVFYAVNITHDHFEPSFKKYNQKLWLQSKDEYDCIRGRMYNDLAQNYLKSGLGYTEIINLLGKPFYIKDGYYYEKLNRTVKRVSYELGVCRLVFGSDHYLVLYFDLENSLLDFRMVEQ